MTRALDHAIPLGFVFSAVVGTWLCVVHDVPSSLLGGLVVGPLAAAAAALERARPERDDHRAPDQPLLVEAAHFLLDYQLGYALALGGCALISQGLAWSGAAPLWPRDWPLALQVGLAVLVTEGSSYWQHRLIHRVPWLWRFHALHHSGERLNLLRAGRFHFVDVGSGALLFFAPLVLLGAPDAIFGWVTTLAGVFGVLQHANVRMRTHPWLDAIVCTPAVHRHHHSRAPEEQDRNFGTTFMIFDVLFGTWERPRPAGPPAIGLEDDPVPRGFWRQVIGPFL